MEFFFKNSEKIHNAKKERKYQEKLCNTEEKDYYNSYDIFHKFIQIFKN